MYLHFSINSDDMTIKDNDCKISPPDKPYKPQEVSETGIYGYLWLEIC